jgi:hypothetical protein
MSHFERNYFGESQIRVDDVVFLENGMVVECLDCPVYVQKLSNPYSNQTSTHRITIGEKYDRQVNLEMIRHTIFTHIEHSFAFFFVPFDADLAKRYVKYQIPEFDETPFVVPQGLYIVCGMKKYLRGQVVTCKTYKAGENRPEFIVCFYQGIHHPTNIERLRVITDPESFAG